MAHSPAWALLHKRDHFLFPKGASGEPLTFPSYDEAVKARADVFNAHSYRAVPVDPLTGKLK